MIVKLWRWKNKYEIQWWIQPCHPSPLLSSTTTQLKTVDSIKYPRLTIDNKLSFNQHTSDIQKRSHQRLYAIRKLKGLYVAPHLLLLLYKCIVQPILLYCSTCFFNMLTVKNRVILTRVTNIAAKLIGLPTVWALSELNLKAISRIASTIAQDNTHPLNCHLTIMPSGRRYRSLLCRRARYGKSLVPAAIAALNKMPR